MGHHDAQGAQHHICVHDAADHGIFSGGHIVGPRLLHGGGGDAVGANRQHLRLWEALLDCLDQQLSKTAALAVDHNDLHTYLLLSGGLPPWGPAGFRLIQQTVSYHIALRLKSAGGHGGQFRRGNNKSPG